jgi:hypothetical protein
MRMTRALAVLAATIAVALWPRGVAADPPADDQPYASQVSLSGPRFGVSFLSPGMVEEIERTTGNHVGPAVTQFGWQFEKRFMGGGDLSGVTEWVLLVGGMEHGVVLPSLTWLVGVRTRAGTEFGVGPNVSPAGAAIVLAAGRTFRAGALNLPVNVAVVPSAQGVRVGLLLGFNTRR